MVASRQLQPVLLLRQRGTCVLRRYQRWHPLKGNRAPNVLRLSRSVTMWRRNSCLGSRVVPPSAHGEHRKGGSRAETSGFSSFCFGCPTYPCTGLEASWCSLKTPMACISPLPTSRFRPVQTRWLCSLEMSTLIVLIGYDSCM